MTQDQDNISSMFETTNGVLGEHKAWWQGIPAFADAVTRVGPGTAAIRVKAGERGPTGDTGEKTAVRDRLEEGTLMVADRLAALAAKVEVTKSQLGRMADTAGRGVRRGRVADASASLLMAPRPRRSRPTPLAPGLRRG